MSSLLSKVLEPLGRREVAQAEKGQLHDALVLHEQVERMLKDPKFRADIHTRSTQIGADLPVAQAVRLFHHESGATGGRLWIQEKMDELGLDRIVVLDLGKVIAVGTPAEIQQNAEVRRAYLGTTHASAETAQ